MSYSEEEYDNCIALDYNRILCDYCITPQDGLEFREKREKGKEGRGKGYYGECIIPGQELDKMSHYHINNNPPSSSFSSLSYSLLLSYLRNEKKRRRGTRRVHSNGR